MLQVILIYGVRIEINKGAIMNFFILVLIASVLNLIAMPICAAQATFVWAKRLGGDDGTRPRDIVVDGAGSVYTTGGFYGTVDFDPGPEVFELTALEDTLLGGGDIWPAPQSCNS